jgi:hypothetical protein
MLRNPDTRADNFSGRVTKITELLAEKHKSFRGESLERKTLHEIAREERKRVEHSRETICLMASFADFNTTSADDQDEF